MPSLDFSTALEILRHYGAYDWLTKSGQTLWSVTEIVDNLEQQGAPIKRATIVHWIEQGHFPGAQDFEGRIGWRIQREDLILFFAQRMRAVEEKDIG